MFSKLLKAVLLPPFNHLKSFRHEVSIIITVRTLKLMISSPLRDPVSVRIVSSSTEFHAAALSSVLHSSIPKPVSNQSFRRLSFGVLGCVVAFAVLQQSIRDVKSNHQTTALLSVTM